MLAMCFSLETSFLQFFYFSCGKLMLAHCLPFHHRYLFWFLFWSSIHSSGLPPAWFWHFVSQSLRQSFCSCLCCTLTTCPIFCPAFCQPFLASYRTNLASHVLFHFIIHFFRFPRRAFPSTSAHISWFLSNYLSRSCSCCLCCYCHSSLYCNLIWRRLHFYYRFCFSFGFSYRLFCRYCCS